MHGTTSLKNNELQHCRSLKEAFNSISALQTKL